MTKSSPRASIRRLRRRGIEEGIGEIEFLRFVLRGQRKPSGSKRRPRRQPYAVRGVFALLRSLRCPCIGHSERAEKPAPPVILRRSSSGHPELVAARRQGRRRTAFAASPEAFAAPLPKKFFDTFWEPCKSDRVEGSCKERKSREEHGSILAFPLGGKVSFGTNDGRGEKVKRKAERPSSVGFAASFPQWGKPRVK